MKKANMLVCVMLLALCMSCMTACGNKNNTGGKTGTTGVTGTTGTTATKAPTTTTAPAGATTGATTGAVGTRNESTGAVQGIVNDVERGVEDLTTTTKTTKAADESR